METQCVLHTYQVKKCIDKNFLKKRMVLQLSIKVQRIFTNLWRTVEEKTFFICTSFIYVVPLANRKGRVVERHLTTNTSSQVTYNKQKNRRLITLLRVV